MYLVGKYHHEYIIGAQDKASSKNMIGYKYYTRII